MKSLFFLISAFFILSSCLTKDSDKRRGADRNEDLPLNNLTEVKVKVIKYENFDKEIISNGKLAAFRKVDLNFRVSSNPISLLNVKNGDKVKAGQIIAKLENFVLNNTYNQRLIEFERIKLDLQDLLIGQGYNPSDTNNIPKDVLKIAQIKSGYKRIEAEIREASHNVYSSILRAPFDGVIANLFTKEGNVPSNEEKVCTLIDDSKFEAEFHILESELSTVKKNQAISISPYSFENISISGFVTQINPVVDENGLVMVKAECRNVGHNLFEGMNVRVRIKDQVTNQLVIPKEALIDKNEKEVVFTVSKGLAKWNYVKKGLENSASYTIIEGLKDGDSVIVDGTLNLVHESKIKVKEIVNEIK